MILVTGSAGFIGSHVLLNLAKHGNQEIVGVDAITPYYSPELKYYRLNYFKNLPNVAVEKIDLGSIENVRMLFNRYNIESVIHLAAQPGVRLGVTNFEAYNNNNLQAFTNILQISLENKVTKFLYASSSSVYGNNSKIPFSENELLLQPVSYYGATKLSNEILAKSALNYSPTKVRGLRFFTVYGPAGRPDMAYFKLINRALYGSKFDLFGDGSKIRDFTYIEDISNSIVSLHDQLNDEKEGFNDVVNIAGGDPKCMIDLISEIELITSKKLTIEKLSDDSLDVTQTIADRTYLEKLIGKLPSTPFHAGLKSTVDWHLNNPKLNQNT